jgi:hypothetical protein
VRFYTKEHLDEPVRLAKDHVSIYRANTIHAFRVFF